MRKKNERKKECISSFLVFTFELRLRRTNRYSTFRSTTSRYTPIESFLPKREKEERFARIYFFFEEKEKEILCVCITVNGRVLGGAVRIANPLTKLGKGSKCFYRVNSWNSYSILVSFRQHDVIVPTNASAWPKASVSNQFDGRVFGSTAREYPCVPTQEDDSSG